MIKDSKYCSDVMQKHFKIELVMAAKDDEDFENPTKCWICDNVYGYSDSKVTNYCYITRK